MQIKMRADAPQEALNIEGYYFERGETARDRAGNPIDFDAELGASILTNPNFEAVAPAPVAPSAPPAKNAPPAISSDSESAKP
ncbi:MAG: hypothetical protein JWM87_738 [Candidatus Eremiobacteraeota bacterium]|nr:hypothetical protein [Candidatus Eremiobacteraeota bacterium]